MIYSEDDLEELYRRMNVDLPDRESLVVRIEHAHERIRELSSLKEQEGYKYMRMKLKEQLAYRFAEHFQMPAGMDNAVRNLYTSGEIAGIKLALDFVDTLIEAIKESMKTEQTMLNNIPDESED